LKPPKFFSWTLLYAVLLIFFTTYVALDTFVITRVYAVVPTVSQSSNIQTADAALVSDTSATTGAVQASAVHADAATTGDSVFTASPVVTDSSYTDQNISITITEYREYDTTIYVADVQLKSAEYLRTAFAQSAFGRNISATTSVTSSANNAILAINGDNYGSRQRGYVIRAGVIYRDAAATNQEDLVIESDGSLRIVNEADVTAADLLAGGARDVFSFGPALITDGQIAVTEEEEVGKAKASNPRTAIAVVDDLHYLLVVSDGRTNASEGLSLYQLAEFMQGLGVSTAYNLDGGGSSTMVFNGQVINNPTTDGRNISERWVTDIVYIGY
jgi:exopolysaccharide biosynthesis protein